MEIGNEFFAVLERACAYQSEAERKAFVEGVKYGKGSREEPAVVASVSTGPTEKQVERVERVVQGEQVPHQKRPRYKMAYRGVRAQLLRYLSTGPCPDTSLMRAMELPVKQIRRGLSQLLFEKLVVQQTSTHGGVTWMLTADGHVQAKYYLDNPTHKIRHGRWPKKGTN